jgi:hypothetical protein
MRTLYIFFPTSPISISIGYFLSWIASYVGQKMSSTPTIFFVGCCCWEEGGGSSWLLSPRNQLEIQTEDQPGYMNESLPYTTHNKKQENFLIRVLPLNKLRLPSFVI